MPPAPRDDNYIPAINAENDLTGAAEPVTKDHTTGGMHVHQVGEDVTDLDITTHPNYAKKYFTSTGPVTDGVVWSPSVGKRWHVAALFIQVSANATVTLEDDLVGGDSPFFKSEFAANSGAFLVFPEHYPLASGEDAADLLITTSAGNVYVTVTGYEV